MNRKDELIEKIIFEMCGGDLTADLMDRYHPVIVSPIIGEVMDGLLRSAYRQSSSQLRRKDSTMLDPFSKPYVVDVLKDSRGFYADLPVRITDLMDNDGIRYIADKCDEDNHFAAIPANAGMYYAQDHDGNTAFNYYKLEGQRVRFKFRVKEKSQVIMLLVPVFDDLEDADITGAPEIISKNGVIGVAEEVKRRMLTMPQTKTTEDNTTK